MPPKKRSGAANAAAGAGASAPTARKKQKTPKGGRVPQSHINVDEGFEEGGDVHVHVGRDGTIYDASLNLSNVSGNNNKFYILQLLVDDSKKGKKKKDAKYYAHARWGRVGEHGQIKTVEFDEFDAALEEFDKRFKSKSGLDWESRTAEPKSGKYTFVEKAYDSEDDEGPDDSDGDDGGNNDTGSKSSLDIATQRLMELIFNQNHFNSVLENIGYNQDKLPLGKLDRSTLKTGFEQLKELASLIKHPSLARNKYNRSRGEVLEEWTNKYYSTIPHVFGRDRPPLIDNDSILRKEVAMLDTLTDMGVANAIMKSSNHGGGGGGVSRLDRHFRDLKLKELTPLDHKSSEYKELQQYLIDSSASNHGMKYRLQDIFRVERPDEGDRFKKSTSKLKDSNRLLLWHGSRTTNYGGILSTGLRIAPPEAPLNGYAFGKGIYLADVSSKSANYCMSSLSGNTGLLLLVEAELSNPMYEITSGDIEAESKAHAKNCIATKGVGRTAPQGWKDAGCVHPDLKGVRMPKGKCADSANSAAVAGGFLAFNEYICYQVEHLRLRYLLKVGM